MKTKLLKTILPIASIMTSVTLFAGESAAKTLAKDVELSWILIAGALVFFMQAGFLMLEAGLVRAKNTINVAIKNLFDFIIGSLGFLTVGFGLMFGLSHSGIIGTDLFMLHGYSSGKEMAFFFFQLTFMATAATIVSGAVAERISFIAYIIISCLISVLIYPVFGHWTWGGGWISSYGFYDFAGSTVVHSVGGWVALAGVIVLGPRRGRFNEDGSSNKLYGHNLPIAVLGTMILWFGWIGFNGGSTLSLTDAVPGIIVNTFISASAGGCIALMTSMIFTSHASAEDTMNGSLAGLVAITAGCSVVSVESSIIIGVVAGILVVLASKLLEKMKLDDVVGAFPVHGVCGIWGTLAVAIFAIDPAKNGISLKAQLIGIGTCAVWAFGSALLIFIILKHTIKLRVSTEDEQTGLNIVEHGARTTMLDLIKDMSSLLEKKDFSKKLTIEDETEAGVIGEMLNNFIIEFSEVVAVIKRSAFDFSNHSQFLQNFSNGMATNAVQQSEKIHELEVILKELADAFSSVESISKKQMDEIIEATKRGREVQEGFSDITSTMDNVLDKSSTLTTLFENSKSELENAADNIHKLDSLTANVSGMVDVISDISEKLNLLSINATIEAAHAKTEGHGFAIVANEVGELADSASKIAKQAGKYLHEIKDAVTNEISEITNTVKSFDNVRNVIHSSDEMINKLKEMSNGYRSVLNVMGENFGSIASNSTNVINSMKSCMNFVMNVNSFIKDINTSSENLTNQGTELKDNSLTLNDKSKSLNEMISDFKISEKNLN